MNIHTIYLHPAVLQAEAMLSREQPYPEDFTLAERTAERMTRARNGLAYVMTELAPRLDDEQAAILRGLELLAEETRAQRRNSRAHGKPDLPDFDNMPHPHCAATGF